MRVNSQIVWTGNRARQLKDNVKAHSERLSFVIQVQTQACAWTSVEKSLQQEQKVDEPLKVQRERGGREKAITLCPFNVVAFNMGEATVFVAFIDVTFQWLVWNSAERWIILPAGY